MRAGTAMWSMNMCATAVVDTMTLTSPASCDPSCTRRASRSLPTLDIIHCALLFYHSGFNRAVRGMTYASILTPLA